MGILDQLDRGGTSPWGGWSLEDVEETEELVDRPAAQTQSRGKPLKINRDLLLYRAKVARQAAFRAPTLLEKLKHQKEAESMLRRCLSLDATDGRTYVALGKLLVQQRRYDEARSTYEEGSTATGGQNEYIWQAWATLEARLGKASQARKLYDAAIVANRKHAASWHGWGLLEKRQGNLVKARDLWLKGIRATEGTPNPHLYQSIAVLAGEMGYVEEARRWFREGTRTIKGKQSHALWHAWAILEASKGETSAVRYLFRKGLETNPRSRYIYLDWGRWEKSQGQIENARSLFKRGHQLNSLDAPLLQAWALLERDEGKLDEARQLFEAGSRADPHHLHVWQAWGVLEHRAGNISRARELFQQGVWAQPRGKSVAYVWQAWGVLEAQQGNIDLARQLFKCAVKADPTSEKSWLAWAAMEEAQGALQRAEELRSYRMQNFNEIVLPNNFGVGLGPDAPDSPFSTVINTIKEWFTKVETARSIARRPPPSYMRLENLGADQEEGTPPVEEPPSLDEMQRFDSSELRLPAVPSPTADVPVPPRAYNWTASQELPLRS
ncbi:PsbB mRNA maturation factor Mbb1, chloroplastic [Coccomyxa sp. Obi]|nr:PsbB mRNA maturation factor Mbb1, chloroplastic [Coccomyxa sp. Obi]